MGTRKWNRGAPPEEARLDMMTGIVEDAVKEMMIMRGFKGRVAHKVNAHGETVIAIILERSD